MTQLQQVEFQLLQEFDRVCRELEIPYFLVCGSALGAVKYGGFIPWDDDVDVAMYRPDYERFCKEAPAILPPELFLQNHRTEPRFPQSYSKLRHSGTTYIEISAAKLPIHHGVFLDLFPLDGYPNGKMSARILEFRKRLYKSMLLSAFDVPGGVLQKLWRALGICRRTDRVVRAFEKMVTRYPVEQSAVLCNHGNWQGKLDYASAEEFGEGAWMTFEGFRVRVPVLYDRYLRRKYGDYSLDPPLEKQVGHHYCTVCDCEKPYSFYTEGNNG